MATAARIPIEQYLKTSYEPDAELVNGEIEERFVGEYDHSLVQGAILMWIHARDKQWNTRTVQGQRTRLTSDNVRIPDVSVFPRDLPVEPVFSHPQLIVVEVLSAEDRQLRVQQKIEDYRRFEVPHIWIVDPARRIGWDCSDGNWIRKSHFEVGGSAIYLDLEELFHDLDEAEA
jgi:Uma2 family endonuclease